MCPGEIVRRYLNYLLINECFLSPCRKDDVANPDSIMIIMKEFLFSICFISLSSNLKLSIDIFVMSLRHVFAEIRFIFVKRSCSRPRWQKSSHLYLYSAFNNTDCVKALNSIKLENRVSVMYNNKIKHSIFS